LRSARVAHGRSRRSQGPAGPIGLTVGGPSAQGRGAADRRCRLSWGGHTRAEGTRPSQWSGVGSQLSNRRRFDVGAACRIHAGFRKALFIGDSSATRLGLPTILTAGSLAVDEEPTRDRPYFGSVSTWMAGMGSCGPPSPVSGVIPGSEQRCRGGNGGRPPLTMKKVPRGPGAAAPCGGSGAAPPRPKHPARPDSSEDFRCRPACERYERSE